MMYVALLRGINVGGNNKIDMAKLKLVFEGLGFTDVKTYINSGNIIFGTNKSDHIQIVPKIEQAIEREFGLKIPVVIRSLAQIQRTCDTIPNNWVNDSTMKCDVLFLWDEVDKESSLDDITVKRELVDLKYTPGAIIWRIDKDNVTRGGIDKLISSSIYKKTTIRNCNTVRKLRSLMEAAESA